MAAWLLLLLAVLGEFLFSRFPERGRLREAKVHQSPTARRHVEQKIAWFYVASTERKRSATT
jgi:hypothetical protein